MPTLTWTGKEEALRAVSLVPFRLIEPHPAVAAGVIGDAQSAQDNLLIQGDNLEALKALIPYYGGRVKCIFIDPPYNTGSAFEHYDDNLEHSMWLSMMYPRMELLRELLAEEGTVWVSIDDNEGHYLKVMMDEVFGRRNFVANVVWQKKFSPQSDAKWLSDMHDHIHVYAKEKTSWKPNLLPRSQKQEKNFKNPDNDSRGPWASADYTCAKNKDERPNLYYPIVNPSTGAEIWPDATRVWAFDREGHNKNIAENLIWWGKKGTNRIPRLKKFQFNVLQGMVPTTVWLNSEVGNNQDARRESLRFNRDEPFSTPKPEALIERIIHIATRPDDIVLDSFLGSGTTAAVAHKMSRHWIGIEMGEHAVSHCLPRLRKVVEGEQGGISEAVAWKGGGGFRFAKLGETIFNPDGSLNKLVTFQALAAHIWWRETGTPIARIPSTPFIGSHDGKAYYLLYNGILGDKRPEAGNVLTSTILTQLPSCEGQKVIFAEACLIPVRNLERLGVIFRQVPYDLGGLHA